MRNQFKLLAGVFALIWTLSGCAANSDRTLGQNIDDTNTTAAVKAQLARDEISSLFRIEVYTDIGVVTLNGNVSTPDQIAHVEKIARGVNGVKDVVNKVQVQTR